MAQVERLAEVLRQPLARLVACSRRSTLAALDGDLPLAASQARLAWDIGSRASLPDADAVLWGQLFAVWLCSQPHRVGGRGVAATGEVNRTGRSQ